MEEKKELWFVTGSQHLYGEETLKQVASHSAQIVEGLNASGLIPLKLVCKETVKTSDEITQLMLEANTSRNCIGIVT